MTSGGTESILMACFTYRNIARERGIKIPEMYVWIFLESVDCFFFLFQNHMNVRNCETNVFCRIVPITAHAAFDKVRGQFSVNLIMPVHVFKK